MRAGLITNRNLSSPWASTHFYIHQALRSQGLEAVHVAGDVVAEHHTSRRPRILRRRFTKKRLDPFMPVLAKAVEQEVERGSYDVLLALHASTIIPSCKIDRPLVYVTDATAALLSDYYPIRKDLSKEDIWWLQKCEEQTISKSDAIVVPTRWAAESVLLQYKADPQCVHIVEWGANLDGSADLANKSVEKVDDTIRFMFVGLDWHRKGGDVAVEMVQLLRARGIKAELTVVGVTVPRKYRRPYVHSVGKLNRAIPEESSQLDQLYHAADFCIHPARAECYGHVLCEALAYGIPVISTRTGGISQCVIDGETGILLPPGASPGKFAHKVSELLEDKPLLSAMRANTVEDYRDRLNWDRWAERMQNIMQHLLSPAVTTGFK